MDSVFRLRFHSKHDPALVGERTSENDEAAFHERVHQRRVSGPAGLFL